MKKTINALYKTPAGVCLVWILFLSCEQTHFEPDLAVAPGGGTLTTYKAYTLDSVPGMGNVYGRVVFWEGNSKSTLVQLSLYNTIEGQLHPSGIFRGALAEGSVEELTALYSIDGAKGEFSVHKFFVIDDEGFYDDLDLFDAHVTVFSSSSQMEAISAGDVGLNATPVQTN